MKVLNKHLCEVCQINIPIGIAFGGKWTCGECIVKLDNKLKEQKKKYFDTIIKEIKENGNT